MQKITPTNEPEVFLNAFERMTTVACWAQDQWALMLIQCLIGLAQEAVDILSAANLIDYDKVKTTILQTLNISSEAYRQSLREINLRSDYHSWLISQKIRAVYFH